MIRLPTILVESVFYCWTCHSRHFASVIPLDQQMGLILACHNQWPRQFKLLLFVFHVTAVSCRLLPKARFVIVCDAQGTFVLFIILNSTRYHLLLKTFIKPATGFSPAEELLIIVLQNAWYNQSSKLLRPKTFLPSSCYGFLTGCTLVAHPSQEVPEYSLI